MSKKEIYSTKNYFLSTSILLFSLLSLFFYSISFQTVKADEIELQVTRVDPNTVVISAPRNGHENYKFAVWTEQNGQDDLIWSDGVVKSDSLVEHAITASSHNNEFGKYIVHCYTPEMTFAGFIEFDFNKEKTPNQGSSNVIIGERSGNGVPVTVINTDPALDILAAVWSEENGQDDLIWWQLNPVDNGRSVIVDLAQHKGVGLYNCHVYSRNSAGEMSPIGAYAFNVATPSSSVTVDTPIMGNSGITPEQLQNFYLNNSPVAFPEYYQARGVSLLDFARIYVEEANAENIRVDLAFCQAMHETNFLRFTGDVNISQFNFAGLGATGGVPGENFAALHGDNANGIRMGVRAQIQHLKAYASTEPLNQPCVDTRYDLVSPHGKAPTIGGLSSNWSVGSEYGEHIINYIEKIQ